MVDPVSAPTTEVITPPQHQDVEIRVAHRAHPGWWVLVAFVLIWIALAIYTWSMFAGRHAAAAEPTSSR